MGRNWISGLLKEKSFYLLSYHPENLFDKNDGIERESFHRLVYLGKSESSIEEPVIGLDFLAAETLKRWRRTVMTGGCTHRNFLKANRLRWQRYP